MLSEALLSECLPDPKLSPRRLFASTEQVADVDAMVLR